MKNTLKLNLTELIGAFVVLLLFVVAAYFSQMYENEIRSYVRVGGVYGMASYVAITVVAIVLAPISTLPLLPLAATLWGSFLAALLSILGWALGAQIAFLIAKRWGRPVVRKLIDIEKADAYTRLVIGKRPFVSMLLLRMVVPVDVLSYAIGLFGNVRGQTHFWATFIGISPFAFVFSYAAGLPMGYQIAALAAAGAVAILAFIRIRRRRENI